MAFYPPKSFIADRYEVIQAPEIKDGSPVGRLVGGMGFIYICRDTKTDRPVALKTFKPELLHDRLARNRFLSEGTAWVELGSHPHIVRCYEVKYSDPDVFLILELIAKEAGMQDASLRHWMGSPMPVERALLFALQIARGMQYVVEKMPGFVHCDLTPGNVLVGADKLLGLNVNRLRVTDFGLAAIRKDKNRKMKDEVSEPIHQAHGLAGTPLYMAPEQWKTEPVDVFTDVYALGCILYDLLIGRVAKSEPGLSELKAAHCNGKLRPLPRSLPGPVRNFLKHSLAATAGERYQAWHEVTAALEGLYIVCSGQPTPPESGQESESISECQSMASSYNELGASYAHMGNTQTALGYFEKSLNVFRQIGDRRGEGASLRNLGNAHVALGDGRRALEYYERCLTIARETDDRRREGNVLGNIGEVYRNLGDARRALDYYEQYLAIAREIGNRRAEGNALCSLGLAHADLNEANHAIGCYEQYLAIAREIGDRRGEGNALGNLGNAYLTLGKTETAIDHYKPYRTIARAIGDRIGEGNALGGLGNAYLALGKTDIAIQFYEQRLEIARKLGDRRGEENALGNLGIASAQQGKREDALHYYQQRLEIAREIGDKMGLCATLFNMGHLYMQNGQAEESARAWVNVYVIAKQMNMVLALQKLANLAPKVGLPEGLDGWEKLAAALPKSNDATANAIGGEGGPVYVLSCAATSAADIAAYYDRSGYPNLYKDASVQYPETNESFGTWTDVAGDTYYNNPLVASHLGVDGRTTRGTIDDYWVNYNNDPGPYTGNS